MPSEQTCTVTSQHFTNRQITKNSFVTVLCAEKIDDFLIPTKWCTSLTERIENSVNETGHVRKHLNIRKYFCNWLRD